jgi:hypothetical protein
MIGLAAASVWIVADLTTLRLCVVNGADETISVFGQQAKGDGEKVTFFFRPPNIEAGRQYCWTKLWDSEMPFRFSVNRASDNAPSSEWPAHAVQCPEVAPGHEVNFVVSGQAGGELKCDVLRRE